jgi:hypothetical protein
MKIELEIVRFNSEDVITASSGGACECESCEVIFDGDVL